MIKFDHVGHSEETGNDSDSDDPRDMSNFSSINEISQSFAPKETKVKEAQPKHCQGTFKELWADKDLVINLVLMALVWTSCSFTYYLGKF